MKTLVNRTIECGVVFLSTVITLAILLAASQAFADEPMIVPGQRVGKFLIGMTRQEVLKLAPNPQENKPDMIVYQNYSTGNRLMFLVNNNRIYSIGFTNKAWNTAEGLNAGNFRLPTWSPLFTHHIDSDGNDTYDYYQGGLAFWINKNGEALGMVDPNVAPVATVAIAQLRERVSIAGPTKANFDRLRANMSPQQVQEILGQPASVSGDYGQSTTALVWYYCWNGVIGCHPNITLQRGQYPDTNFYLKSNSYREYWRD